MRTIVFALLTVFSAAGYAQGLSYNHVDIGYSQYDIDDVDVDGNVIGFGLSVELNESFYAFGSYGLGDLDGDFGIDADFDQLSIGIGYHMPLSPQLDLVTGLSYEYAEVSVDGFGSVDDNGFGLSVGLRFAASDALELNGGISYVDFGDGGDDTGFGAGALYNFSNNFALGLSASWTDDTSSYGIGGRYYFGK
jgi:opacity protein-like surface antigen